LDSCCLETKSGSIKRESGESLPDRSVAERKLPVTEKMGALWNSVKGALFLAETGSYELLYLEGHLEENEAGWDKLRSGKGGVWIPQALKVR